MVGLTSQLGIDVVFHKYDLNIYVIQLRGGRPDKNVVKMARLRIALYDAESTGMAQLFALF